MRFDVNIEILTQNCLYGVYREIVPAYCGLVMVERYLLGISRHCVVTGVLVAYIIISL